MFFVNRRARADSFLEEAFWRYSVILVRTPLEMDQLKTKSITHACCKARNVFVQPEDYPRLPFKFFETLMLKIPTSFPELRHLRIMWPVSINLKVTITAQSTVVFMKRGEQIPSSKIIYHHLVDSSIGRGQMATILRELINERNVTVCLQLPISLGQIGVNIMYDTLKDLNNKERFCWAECDTDRKELIFMHSGKLCQVAQDLDAVVLNRKRKRTDVATKFLDSDES